MTSGERILYLLEEYDNSLKFEEDNVIVALTPRVCYELDRKAVRYSIIEDFYDLRKLFSNEYDYLRKQFKWFKKFDAFLKDKIDSVKQYDLNLASIYSYYLKTCTVDPVIFRAYTLKELFDKTEPQKVIIISKSPQNAALTDQLDYGDKSLYSYLVPLFCKKYNIPYVSLFVNSPSAKGDAVRRINYKKLLNYFSYSVRMLSALMTKMTQQNGLNILLLNYQYGGENLMVEALKRGHNVYFFKNDAIFRMGWYKKFRLTANNNVRDDSEFKQTAGLLKKSELIQWINDECSIDVTELVLPRLQFFVSSVCPDISEYFKTFIKFYSENSIDFAVSPYMQSIPELAAIAAARYCNVRTVCCIHGDEIFTNTYWYFKEISNFDICIATNEEHRQNLVHLCKRYNLQTKIYKSPNLYSNILNLKNSRKANHESIEHSINRIIYLPVFFHWDKIRIGDGGWLSCTKYYRFQKQLLTYLSTKKEYMFIWKGLHGADSVANPIPDMIREYKLNNIQVSFEPFRDHLRTASRVLCDFPSTALYESVIAGVPTMCISTPEFNIRETGAEIFGNILKKCVNMQDVFKEIDNFLNADPEDFTLSLDTGNKSIIEIIEDQYRDE